MHKMPTRHIITEDSNEYVVTNITLPPLPTGGSAVPGSKVDTRKRPKRSEMPRLPSHQSGAARFPDSSPKGSATNQRVDGAQ